MPNREERINCQQSRTEELRALFLKAGEAGAGILGRLMIMAAKRGPTVVAEWACFLAT